MTQKKNPPRGSNSSSAHSTETPAPESGGLPVFLKEWAASFAPGFFSIDPSDLSEYGRDWTRAYVPAPIAIAFPTTTVQVAELVKLCNQHRLAIVPSGGRTGLSGGAVAHQGEIVLSLMKMNRMDPVDLLAHTVHVQAGAVTEAVHQHCEPHGLTWPVDFASKGSSHVGGNISTNAGGVNVIRYGLTRNWVLGLQVVTPQGEILELNGALEKNQTGLDLRQLFIGSEGTLGIITEATLKLTRLPGECGVFFFACQSLDQVLALFKNARNQSFSVQAFEVLDRACLKSVLKHRNLNPPFQTNTIESCTNFVLIEVERRAGQSGAPDSETDAWLETLFEKAMVEDGVLAQSPAAARDLWSMREGVSESIMAQGMVHKHDVSVPISQLQSFTGQFVAALEKSYRGFEIYNFGHIGDGNLHINIRKPDALSREDFLKTCKAIDQDLFRLVRDHQGSISAEHGIGLLKKYALPFSRTPAEIAVMKAVKKALDPNGILNPGKVFDLSG